MKAQKTVCAAIMFIGAAVMAVFLYSAFIAFVRSRESGPPDPLTSDGYKLLQIAIACKTYASDHGGFYPPDFSYLFDGYFIRSPRPLLAFGEPRPDGDLADAMEWTSFVYVRGHTSDSPPDAVLAFLPPGYHKGDLGIVVFVGGETKAVPLRGFARTLNRELLQISSPGVEAVDAE